jgi:pyrimidine-nucleoside phosphorylase
MNPALIIKLKRDKKALTREQLEFFIEGYLKGTITDYQMSAFLMAVYFNGMTDDETYELTRIMLNSGKTVDLSFINKPKVDKHSTGGVGDKTSLILAPLAAACGLAVPMISGRGLGHTGGTLDKLESIPGFRINYSIDEFSKLVSETGVSMIGQTAELAPADKRIYALRDVTATVDCIPLIIASIMSKKIAEGTDSIVFDVKLGNGANLQIVELSHILAKELISVSKKFGKKAVAVLTDMEEPLGYKIGNWLEVEECMQCMEGEIIPDLYKVNNVLAGAMLYLGGKAKSIDEGESIAEQSIKDGSTINKFKELVKAQEGDVSYLEDWRNLKRPAFSRKIFSPKNGYISKMRAAAFGQAAVELGCGRKKAEDKVDYLSGIVLFKKYGESIKEGEAICEIFSEKEEYFGAAESFIMKAVEITDNKPPSKNLIIDILE